MDGYFTDSGHSQVYHLDTTKTFQQVSEKTYAMDVELDHDRNNTLKYQRCQLVQNLQQLRHPLPASDALYCFFIERVVQLAPQAKPHYC
jgi:hypothetical protein